MDFKTKGFSRATELSHYKIKSIEDGKELVAEIEQTMNDILVAMREDISNESHKQYTDLHYDFKKARNNIQSQMGTLVKAKYRVA